MLIECPCLIVDKVSVPAIYDKIVECKDYFED